MKQMSFFSKQAVTTDFINDAAKVFVNELPKISCRDFFGYNILGRVIDKYKDNGYCVIPVIGIDALIGKQFKKHAESRLDEHFPGLTEKNFSTEIRQRFLNLLNGEGSNDSPNSLKWIVVQQCFLQMSVNSKLDASGESDADIAKTMLGLYRHPATPKMTKRFINELKENLPIDEHSFTVDHSYSTK